MSIMLMLLVILISQSRCSPVLRCLHGEAIAPKIQCVKRFSHRDTDVMKEVSRSGVQEALNNVSRELGSSPKYVAWPVLLLHAQTHPVDGSAMERPTCAENLPLANPSHCEEHQ